MSPQNSLRIVVQTGPSLH